MCWRDYLCKLDICPHGGNHPAEHDATASSSNTPSDAVVAAKAALLDEVAAAMEARHSELQLQLERALEKIDAVTEDNQKLAQELKLVRMNICELIESNKELERVAWKQAKQIECLETKVWSSTDWHSSDSWWTHASLKL